jgi:UDP-N-acetyl-2-amino-2-deoxyglucuronate dehydrogenase
MKCGIGIVGTGMIAEHHAQALDGVEAAYVAAVVSRSKERALAFAKRFNCRGYDSLSEMLDDPRVEIVSICTPSGSHLEPAVAAAEAGRHILVEKPLEISLDRCDRMIEIAAKKDVQLGGIFQSRFYDASRVVKAAVDAKRFGDPVLADAYVKWYRTQDYYDTGGWKGTVQYDGGGALMNQSIHAVDLLLWFSGEVESVQSYVGVRGHERIEVEDTAVAALRFANGAMGVIEGSTAAFPGFLKRIELSGTDGSAILEEENLNAWSFRKETEEDEVIRRRYKAATGSGGGAADPGAIGVEGHRRQFQSFVESVRKGAPVELDGTEARRAVALICAIYESASTGRRVRVSR